MHVPKLLFTITANIKLFRETDDRDDLKAMTTRQNDLFLRKNKPNNRQTS